MSKVGYQKPPKKSQFQKGKSGNPKGRPKGSHTFKAILEKELETEINISENGEPCDVTKKEAMVKKLISKALSGDLKAIKFLTEHFIPWDNKIENDIRQKKIWGDNHFDMF